jgi:hypothetical protein
MSGVRHVGMMHRLVVSVLQCGERIVSAQGARMIYVAICALLSESGLIIV